MSLTHKPYRAEIDGLRAIAVMSVMLFHAGAPGITAGFLGVDIFFVISGFLITGQIVNSSQQGIFSFLDFYTRRIRRIIPALVVASMLTLPFAIHLMLPDDLENYGQSLVATGLSANNVLLFLTSDYFALETLYKPLVHTWSLGVEEQYYLIVPLLLALAIRIGGRGGALTMLLLASTASFVLALALGGFASEWLGSRSQPANFYLLPSRFWELGTGGLAMMTQDRLVGAINAKGRRRLAGAGILITVASLLLIGEDSSLPGWSTLLPTLGTAIFLIFGDSSGAGAILSSRPMRWLGLISYSTYLYHQPVFAFVRVASLDQPSWPVMIATIPLAMLFGWLSWRFVERPCRNPLKWPTRSVLSFSIGGTLLSIATGYVLYATSGFHSRWPELTEGDPQFGANQNAQYVDAPYAYNHKPFATADRSRNVLIAGDSFARDFINMATETGKFRKYSLTYTYGNYCTDPKILKEIFERARQANNVVLSTWFEKDDVACIVNLTKRLKRVGVHHIAVIGTKNFGFNNNSVMRLSADRRYSWRVRPLANILADNAAAKSAIPTDTYVDLLGILDNGTATVPVFTPGHKFISQDRRHLTKAGARFVGDKVFAQPQFAWVK